MPRSCLERLGIWHALPSLLGFFTLTTEPLANNPPDKRYTRNDTGSVFIVLSWKIFIATILVIGNRTTRKISASCHAQVFSPGINRTCAPLRHKSLVLATNVKKIFCGKGLRTLKQCKNRQTRQHQFHDKSPANLAVAKQSLHRTARLAFEQRIRCCWQHSSRTPL